MLSTTIRKAAPTLAAMTLVVVATTQVPAQIVADDLDFRIHTKLFGDHATNWSREHCDDPNECDIEIKIRDGQRFVIVNGDTVETSELFEDDGWTRLDGFKPKLEEFTRQFMLDDPGWHGFAFFDGGHMDDLDDLLVPHRRFVEDFDFTWLTDETLRKMESRARRLADEVHQSEGSEKAEVEARLQEKLGEIFDYKLDRQQRRIEATQNKLAELQERFESRESARNEIIEERRRELLGTGQDMEW